MRSAVSAPLASSTRIQQTPPLRTTSTSSCPQRNLLPPRDGSKFSPRSPAARESSDWTADCRNIATDIVADSGYSSCRGVPPRLHIAELQSRGSEMDVHFQQNFDSFAPEKQRGSTNLSKTQKQRSTDRPPCNTICQHNAGLSAKGPSDPQQRIGTQHCATLQIRSNAQGQCATRSDVLQ